MVRIHTETGSKSHEEERHNEIGHTAVGQFGDKQLSNNDPRSHVVVDQGHRAVGIFDSANRLNLIGKTIAVLLCLVMLIISTCIPNSNVDMHEVRFTSITIASIGAGIDLSMLIKTINRRS